MKRFILFALLLAPFITQAQSVITIGPKVGASYAFITGGSQPENQPFYTGFNAGGFLTISGASHFGLTIEAMYAQRGGKSKVSTPVGDITATQKLQYLDIPVLFRYFFNTTGNAIRPNIFIGPSFNILTQAQGKVEDGDWEKNTDSFRKFDLGAVIGFGVNIRTLPNQWLTIDARYNQGTLKLGKTGDDGSGNDISYSDLPQAYSASAVLSVGYGFGI